jgi:glycolate oxidase
MSNIVSAGVVPRAIEMMDNLTIGASEQMAHAGWPLDAGAALLVELDGPQAELEARFDEVGALCEKAGCSELRVARDEAERQVFWKMRKAAFPAMGRVSSHYYVQDSVIPRTALGDVLDRIDQLSREYDLQVANVFHAGDGSLHPSSATTACRARPSAPGLAGRSSSRASGPAARSPAARRRRRQAPHAQMFSEATSTPFRLRCAFDPDGWPAQQVMPTPAVRRVPGPTVGTRSRRAWRTLLMDAAGGRGRCAGLRRARRRRHGLGWGHPIRAPELSVAKLDAIVGHNVGD